jgi:hypothetical protein
MSSGKNIQYVSTAWLVMILMSSATSFANPTPRTTSPIRDVNSFLRNSMRTDVGGEGLWLPQLDAKLTAWLAQKPGFVGQVYYVHKTALEGLFQYRFQSEHGGELTAVVADNHWTPAYSTTRYHLKDNDGNSIAQLEETKLINDSEEAFSQITLVSSSARRQTFAIRIDDLVRGSDTDEPGRKPLNVLARRVAFKPMTYYFVDLEITKDYVLCADGFSRGSDGSLARTVDLAAGAKIDFTTRIVFGNNSPECFSKLGVALKHDALRSRIAEFNRWFASNVPAFMCSDPAVVKMYYYRWYLIKKASINARRFIPHHPYPDRVMYEGQAGAWFTKVIGLPLPLQILEARWLRDPAIAAGQARTALTKDDFFDYLNWTPWAIWQLHLVRPNRDLIKDALPAMKRFVASEEAKDDDKDFLPTVWGSWITGMEYQPSFHYFTEPRWDHKRGDEFVTDNQLTKDPSIYRKFLPLERVDEATYYYLNNLAVARASAALGESQVSSQYAARAESVRRSAVEKMWDPQTRFFYDLHPDTHEKARDAKVVDGFFPFLFGELARASELSLWDHLLDPKEFWTPWPVPTASRDCPAFDSHGLWKLGPNASPQDPYRYVDSWNGPTWIFSNALTAEALGSAARMSKDVRLIDAFNRLMKKYTEIQFLHGDHSLPCTVEHYDSLTGENIRLLADYFHSFYNDLVIRYLVGIVPRQDDLIEIDPLARDWRSFSIERVVYRGHSISVKLGKSFVVVIDGKTVLTSRSLKRFVYNPSTRKRER